MTEQVWHPYINWEDYQAGMWRAIPVDAYVESSARLLGNPEAFYNAACDMVRDWPNAAEHNLTNREQNRRAWVGQATCCYLTGAPEAATRLAWWLLLEAERDAANATADLVISEWELRRHLHSRPQLFPIEEARSA